MTFASGLGEFIVGIYVTKGKTGGLISQANLVQNQEKWTNIIDD